MASERLQKVLASAGVASRRQSEAYIAAGRVLVNGVIATLGQRVNPEQDTVSFDGRQVSQPTRRLYIALNKPPGFVTSRRSTHGERTVMELLAGHGHLVPVGRLDKESSGLLLLTSDGDWANLVTHPRFGVEKEYEVLVDGRLDRDDLQALRAGVTLPGDGHTAPARIEVLTQSPSRSRLSVTVIEGKKRQIRRMFAAVGHPVRELRRVRIGPLTLGDLAEGSWRQLRTEEVEAIGEYGSRAGARG